MSNGDADTAQSAREQLSALIDGELPSPAAVAAACSAWKGDAAMRATWHGYQLIGDVLRSDDLASPPAHDSAFLQALRARLHSEPVVLALEAEPMQTRSTPLRFAADSRRRGVWAMPAAVAAGFMAVAGVLLVTRAPVPLTIAAAPQASPTATPVRNVPKVDILPAVPAPAPVAGDQRARIVLRDQQLDLYLAAHKQFGSGTAIRIPALRQVYDEAPGR